MAKALAFRFNDQLIPLEMAKVDRTKLYGFKEIEVLDENNDPCELGTLATDGKTVIGRGGMAIGYLSVDGLWCDRTELRPVDLEGNSIQPVPSSFDSSIELRETISVEKYLDHDIRTVYQLHGTDLPQALVDRLKQGEIFRFSFSFRGGMEADPAFLLMNLDGDLFMLVAKETNLAFVGLQQAMAVSEDDQQPENEGESEELDFTMI